MIKKIIPVIILVCLVLQPINIFSSKKQKRKQQYKKEYIKAKRDYLKARQRYLALFRHAKRRHRKKGRRTNKRSYNPGHGILPVNKLRKGMTGYGLTVFEGTKPKRFKVKIIGVITNESPKASLILARFSGGPLEKTGVIAGMSGSPVYIKGKLVGAVSHAFPGALEPIGAIRPIQEMLNILQKKDYQEKQLPIRFVPFETGLRKKIEKADNGYFTGLRPLNKPIRVNNYGQQMSLLPVKTPILFSGLDNSIIELMRSEMESYGLYPINGGVSGKVKIPKGTSKTLNPGDAVGITLIDGDISAAPVGTVTYRKGNDILIFGHPSFFLGPIDMPMNKQYVHTVVGTRSVSFKLASPLFEVGRIFDDRYSAVAGELGKVSKMIPVQVNIKNEGKQDQFNFRIVKNHLFFPNLLTAAIIQSVFNVSDKSSENSIKFKFHIKVKNLQTGRIDSIVTHDFLTGNNTEKNMFQGFFRLTLPLQALIYNPFIDAEIQQVSVDLEITRGWQACEVTNVTIMKNKIKPGDEVPLLITLRNYKGEEFYKKASIIVPATVKSKLLILGVGSSKTEVALDRTLSTAKYIPKNYDHLIKVLNKDERFNDLVVWIDLPKKGLVLEGEEYPNLPSSVHSILETGNDPRSVSMTSKVKKIFRSNYLIYGVKIVPLHISLDSLDN